MCANPPEVTRAPAGVCVSHDRRKLDYEYRKSTRTERMPFWLEIVEITLIFGGPAALMGMGFWFWR